MKINLKSKFAILGAVAVLAAGVGVGVSKWSFTGSNSADYDDNTIIIDRTFDSITANVSALSLSANRNCSHVSASSGNGYTGVNIADYYTVIKDGVDLDNSGITSAISSGSLVVSTTGDCKYSSGKIYMSNLSSSAATGSKDASITLSFANASTSSSSVNEGNHSDLLTFNRPKSKTCVGPGCNKLVNEQYTVSSTNHNHDDECLDCSESSSCGTECSTVSCNDCPEEDCLNNNCASANKKYNSSLAYNGFLETNSSTSESSVTITGSTTTTEGSWSKKSGSESYNYYCTGTMTQYSSTSTCSGTITKYSSTSYSYYCDSCYSSDYSWNYGDTCGRSKTGYNYSCSNCSRTGYFSGTCGRTLGSITYSCNSCGKSYSSTGTCSASISYTYYQCSSCSKSYSSTGTCTASKTTYTTCGGKALIGRVTTSGTEYICSGCGYVYSSSVSYCRKSIASTTTCGGTIKKYSGTKTCGGTISKHDNTYSCTGTCQSESYTYTCSGTITRSSSTSYYYKCNVCGNSSSSSYSGTTCGKETTTYYTECNKCTNRSGSIGDTCGALQTGTRTYYYCSVCSCRL